MNPAEQITREGYALLPGLISPARIEKLRAALQHISEESSSVRRRNAGGAAYALRNVFALAPDARELACSDDCMRPVAAALGVPAIPVRCLLFDKTMDANWKVGWHQDCAIAVATRRETPGFSGWSVKAGVPHAEAPAGILEQMLALRLHLDDCGESNAPLMVLPGSHREGRLNDERRRYWTERVPVTLTARTGDAILMKPLLLHASAPAQSPAHRRVLHIEYAACALPNGLQWAEAASASG
jgi:hypothetical protein